MTRKHSVIYENNTHILRVDELTDVDGAYVNDATVTLESLVDADGDAVTNVVTPLAMAYVAGSNGRYEGTLVHNAGLTSGLWYDATFLAIDGSNRGEWTEPLRVATRRA